MKLAAVLCVVLLLLSCSKQGKDDSYEEANAYQNRQESNSQTDFDQTDTDKTREIKHIFPNPFRANKEYPVIWPDSLSASSQQGNYFATNLVDRKWNSWMENSEGNGTGEFFALQTFNTSTIAGFALKNGNGNLDLYNRYNRVKTFRIYADGEYLETITVKDSYSFEVYSLKNPVDFMDIRFEIEDVYPGTSYNSACISEILLFNRIVNDDELYDNLISWLADQSVFSIELNDEQITSVSDADKIALLSYMPFDIPGWWRTKISRLEGQSTLKFNDNLPRLDGATAMYPLYSAFVHAVYPEKVPALDHDSYDILYDNRLTMLKYEYFPNFDLLEWYNSGYINDFASIVQCNTTSTAYRRLIEGEADIVFCYEPSQAEINAAASKGLRFNLTPIAKDAFVFIVNEKNPLNNITLQQVRDIYSGRTTNWKSITGVDEPVIAYQRAENSGSQSTLQAIMREDTLMRPIMGEEFVPRGMGGMIRAIVSNYYNYNAAIGYTFLFYLHNMAGSSGIKVLSIDGVTPNRQNILSGAYSFTQTVYAVTAGNESENTRRFIEWILSAQGQEMVRRTGYTPVR
jgi:phosphate transport system substrate-binding protein